MSGALLHGTRRKQRLLLASLVLQANRKVAVDELIGQLWGQRPPASALANLQSYVAQLRRLFADQAPRLETGPGSYQLHAGDEELDHLVFERLVHDGQAACAAGRLTLASQQLTAALGLWRGSRWRRTWSCPSRCGPW
ncbi:hypothetical protein AQJ67_42115 [Streptomyces caeruleatus]|uniref:OmpR/PhoB-type domain-containing protein n=1 Tax=Streptomyces caeruleatus TaxID=661399 RepID=A0A101TGP5_9ACTN|nr:hypothetical protein AQJ67_42115 [Streptomyces caeruleatus]